MTTLYIDADACPVKAEAERVATRLRVPMVLVCNGGLRPSQNPLVSLVIVSVIRLVLPEPMLVGATSREREGFANCALAGATGRTSIARAVTTIRPRRVKV